MKRKHYKFLEGFFNLIHGTNISKCHTNLTSWDDLWSDALLKFIVRRNFLLGKYSRPFNVKTTKVRKSNAIETDYFL